MAGSLVKSSIRRWDVRLSGDSLMNWKEKPPFLMVGWFLEIRWGKFEMSLARHFCYFLSMRFKRGNPVFLFSTTMRSAGSSFNAPGFTSFAK